MSDALPVRNAVRFALLLVVLGLGGATLARFWPEDGAAAPTTISIELRDFTIKAPKHVPAGEVVFIVDNAGPDAHELLVVRSGRTLPLRKDGITVDEDAIEKQTVGVLEPEEPGGIRKLRVRLRPGHYELICNMSGHYLGGMRKAMVVS